MQIVLSEPSDSPRVYLADWLGRSLKPRLLTEFPANMHVRDTSTSPGDNLLAVLVRLPRNREWKWQLYLIDPLTGRYEKAFEDEGLGIGPIAIAPGNQSIAFLSGGQGRSARSPSGLLWPLLDILLYDRTTQRVKPVLRERAYEGLSWTPDGEQLTYPTPEGWIESVTLKTQRIERLVQGHVPAWSPDGKRLAYYREDSQGGAVFIYDPARRISQEVHRASGWIRGFSGELYWSPDGRYLSFNVGMDLIGPTIRRCTVVEVETGKAVKVRSQGMYCGPWLAGQQATDGGPKKAPDTK